MSSSRSKRVPDAARRRAAVSCDHCKRRRAKCIRLSSDDPCTNCAANQVSCETTVPRKHRIYGSVETLSQRYRALDALVVGLFHGADTKSLDGLYQLAANRGIPMPPPDDLSPAPDLFVNVDSESPTKARSSAPLEIIATADKHDDLQSTEEKLIPTTQGVGHYVGPSSSFRFVSAIRSLVGRSNHILRPSLQSSLLAEFTTLRASKALELPGAAQEGREGQESVDDTAAGNLATSPDTSEAVVALLPPRELSDALVLAFFDKVHPDYPLFHRYMFQVLYEALWEPRPGSLRKTDTGWMCCLAMVFVFGAQVLEQHDRQQTASIQRRYLELVRSSFLQLVGTTSLANIQALLLLQLYEHNSGQRNASWMFLGCASRMAIALGLHRELANKDSVECATRRQVWWTLYSFERNLSVMLGRPSAIDDSEVSTRIPADNGELLPRYTESLLHLTQMLGQIRQSTYDRPEEDAGLPSILKAQKLLGDLQSWYNALPAYLRPEWRTMIPHQRRAVLLLQIYYQFMIILATRPYFLYWKRQEISKRQSHTGANTITDEKTFISMKESCLDAAEKTLSYCHLLAGSGILNTVSWLDVYYIYHASFILCLDLLTRKLSGQSLSETQSRHKESVKSIFTVLNRMQLAPTFRILIRVARQFVRIAGAIDNDSDADGRPNIAAETSIHQNHADNTNVVMSTMSVDAVALSSEAVVDPIATQLNQSPIIDNWLPDDFSTLPWSSFDMGAYDSDHLSLVGRASAQGNA